MMDVNVELDRYFSRLFKKSRKVTGLQVLVEGPDVSYSFAEGRLTSAGNSSLSNNHPFHAASVGKLFTSVLTMKLCEEGLLTLDSPIASYLDDGMLDRLFVYKGRDYANEVTVRQLLNHTSGAPDYWDGPVSEQPSFTKRIMSRPNELWTPETLLDFSRNYQHAVGSPGSTFHYSDTGYILLGCLIEKVSAKSFDVNLIEHFFEPLQMNDTYLMFHAGASKQQDRKAIQDLWVNGVEMSQFQSLSCDWSGGGIVSTPRDLVRFQKALWNGDLISKSSLNEMSLAEHKFRSGIHYGLGMMEIRFGEFFFLLRGLPRLKGHIGVTAAHLFCDPDTNTHFVLNFGTTDAMSTSFRALIQICALLKKARKSG